MRWSAWMPVGDLVQQLSGGGSCSSYDRKRPVYLKLNISRPETRYAHTNEHILQATEEQVRKIEAFPHLDGASAIVELKSLMALIQILSTESMTESVAIEFSNLGFTNNVMNQQALAACGGNFKDAVALLCQQERSGSDTERPAPAPTNAESLIHDLPTTAQVRGGEQYQIGDWTRGIVAHGRVARGKEVASALL